jgi:hypothetical protein
MKKTLMLLLATSLIPFLNAATTVSNENDLKTALNGNDKEIILNDSFTTSGDLNIPAGYTVTLIDNAKITLKYEKNSKGKVTTCHNLTGSGTIITGSSTIKTNETRTIECPRPGECVGTYCGKQYDVTTIKKTGGSISYTDESQLGEIKMQSTLCVDDNEPEISLDINPVAVICNVSKGINGGRTFVEAYGTMADACSAVKTDGSQVVVLLQNGSMSGSSSTNYSKSFVLDCAGNEASMTGYKQANDGTRLTYINASSATFLKLTNAIATFINCTTIKQPSSDALNNNQTYYTTAVHLYDCSSESGTLPKFAFSKSSTMLEKDGAGICFFSGGNYATKNFTGNYKVYGGSFTSDPTNPTNYLKSSDLEAVKEGTVWKVRKKAPAVMAAKVGKTEYATLLEALTAAASSGEKVTLLGDIELTDALIINENLTLEFAGNDLTAHNGITITAGAIKFEDSSDFDKPSTISGIITLEGGSLEITYGTYTNNIIVHDNATFTVHHATFDGTIEAAANATINIHGGRFFKDSVKTLLKDNYLATSHEGYWWVGQFPWAIASETTISGAEKAWSIQGLSTDDLNIYLKAPKDRTVHTDTEWYRHAELTSMLTPYEQYTIDCIVIFNRNVATESVKIYAKTQTISTNELLDRNLKANETYRVLSTKLSESNNPLTGAPYTQISYARFLTELKSLQAGLDNLSEDNAGTTCTIEFHLCRQTGTGIESLYTLASSSYTFPMVYTESERYRTLTEAPAGSDVRVLDDTTLEIAAVNEDAKSIDSLELNNHTVTLILPETFDTTKETLLYKWNTLLTTGAFIAEQPLTKGILKIKDDGLYYIPTIVVEGTIPEGTDATEAAKIEEALIKIAADNNWEKVTARAQNSAGEERSIAAVTLFENIHATPTTLYSVDTTQTIVLVYDFGITDITIDREGNVILTATVMGTSDENPADFMEGTQIWLLMDGERVAEMIPTSIGTAEASIPIPEGECYTKHFSVMATNEPEPNEAE